MGVANPAGNFIVVSEGHFDADGIPVVVLAKRTAFTAEEVGGCSNIWRLTPDCFCCIRLPIRLWPRPVGGRSTTPPAPTPFTQLIRSNDPKHFAAHYPYDVSPVTDNAPFFFFTLKLGQILHPKSLMQGIDWKVNLGVAVLGMVLAISLLAVLVFLVLPLARGLAASNRVLGAPALLHRSRPGIHSGGDRFHPALRSVPRSSGLRVDRSGISASAVERCGQHGFPMVVAGHEAGMAAPAADRRRLAALCRRAARPAGAAWWACPSS